MILLIRLEKPINGIVEQSLKQGENSSGYN